MTDLLSSIQTAINPPSPFSDLSGINADSSSQQGTGPNHMGFLDHVLFALKGTPDSMLPPDKVAARHNSEQQASRGAVAAYQNPGEEYMGPPVVGGKSGGLDLGSLIKLFAGGGGL